MTHNETNETMKRMNKNISTIIMITFAIASFAFVIELIEFVYVNTYVLTH